MNKWRLKRFMLTSKYIRTDRILKICIIFLLGFLSANIVSYYMVYGLENPISKNLNFLGYNIKDTPQDYIKENQIEVYNDKIIIHVVNASIGRYAPTGSMKPVFDENANGIRVVPKSEDDIKVGDIITFQQGDYLIIHRVAYIGTDENGKYFITKGDNNTVSDGKVRFKDIKYLTVGMIW